MKAALLAGALLLSPGAAMAQGGVNFAWNQCLPEGGAIDRDYACDPDTGVSIAVGSFMLAADQLNFVGIEVVIDVETTTASLPDWWQMFNPGSCRQTALSARFDFVDAPNVTCNDFWQGQALGAVAAYQTSTTLPPVPGGAPNRARIKIGGTLAQPIALPTGLELYGFKLLISHARSSGENGCLGCNAGACVVLTEIAAVEVDGQRQRLTSPLQNQVITWQCATYHFHSGCGGLAQCFTSAGPSSWGQIKALYR